MILWYYKTKSTGVDTMKKATNRSNIVARLVEAGYTRFESLNLVINADRGCATSIAIVNRIAS